MPERQTAIAGSTEMTQRFVEFVLLHTQNASMFLGRMPNPHTGQPEVNLEIARLLIDQLEMIEDKTRGNLNSEEGHILNNALTNLRLAYVEASGGAPSAPPATPAAPSEEVRPRGDSPASGSGDSTSEGEDAGSRKKFSKSYGA